jgi:Raf kinase inhibitor-like YbhB/YbcL family protein
MSLRVPGTGRIVSGLIGAIFLGSLLLPGGAAFAQRTEAPGFSVRATGLHANQPMPDAQVYDKGGCSGHNRSPELSWRGAPAQTRSFGITIVDPDAPGRGWWHWAVADIPATVSHLGANASASGALQALGALEASNDFGDSGYSGPCPPPGQPHHYVITVYALDTAQLPVEAGRPAALYEHALDLATLATAKLVVTYSR